MKSNKLLALVVCIATGLLFYKIVYDGTVEVKSNIDGNYYKVRNGADKQLRADILADIYLKYNVFINAIRNDQNYNNQENVQRLLYNWDGGVTVKEIGNLENDAAYVINKKNMSFCLQKPSNKINLDELNLITYVALHELSHIMSEEIGHGAEFVNNFEFVLNYAKTLSYFDPILQKQLPLYIPLSELNTSSSYCGVSLKNSMN